MTVELYNKKDIVIKNLQNLQNIEADLKMNNESKEENPHTSNKVEK